MFCKNCGTQTNTDAKFCAGCGTGTENSSVPITNSSDGNVIGTIKCGNCGYVGMGEKARSTWAQVLAWLVVIFAPLITIIYFLATFKWRCPKCKSSFLGIKKEDGVYHAQRGGAGRIVLIILCVLFGIVIIGIISSVILTSLNSARNKADDAKIKAELSLAKTEAELYFDENLRSYEGVCKNSIISNKNNLVLISGHDVICNDTEKAWAMSSYLKSDSNKIWCVDSTSVNQEIPVNIDDRTFCSLETASPENIQISNDAICSNKYPNTRYIVGDDWCDCKSGYEWNTEQTGCYK